MGPSRDSRRHNTEKAVGPSTANGQGHAAQRRCVGKADHYGRVACRVPGSWAGTETMPLTAKHSVRRPPRARTM